MRLNALVILTMLVFSTGLAQECSYKINVEMDEETFKLTKETLVEFMLSPTESVFIYFSLMKDSGVSSLILQISLNAREMPPIMCFDKKSRLSFKMVDGSFLSLPYLDDVNCGIQTEYEDQFDNSTSEAAFYIDPTNLAKFKTIEIETMRITSMNTHFDIDFQKVISNKDIPVPIYPREYFINHLSCIE